MTNREMPKLVATVGTHPVRRKEPATRAAAKDPLRSHGDPRTRPAGIRLTPKPREGTWPFKRPTPDAETRRHPQERRRPSPSHRGVRRSSRHVPPRRRFAQTAEASPHPTRAKAEPRRFPRPSRPAGDSLTIRNWRRWAEPDRGTEQLAGTSRVAGPGECPGGGGYRPRTPGEQAVCAAGEVGVARP
jgi:hypothetical protein